MTIETHTKKSRYLPELLGNQKKKKRELEIKVKLSEEKETIINNYYGLKMERIA